MSFPSFVLGAALSVIALGACSSSSSTSPPPGGGGGEDAAAGDGGSVSPDGSSPGDSGAPSGDGSSHLAIGDPCTSDSECPSGTQGPGKGETTWPNGGACTVVGCGVGDCPGNSWCQPYGQQSYCATLCQPGVVPCTRPGYTCIGGGCLPSSFAPDGG
jgi:hypothetical protein